MTIEGRAWEFRQRDYKLNVEGEQSAAEHGYIQGANDIVQRAVEWLRCVYLEQYLTTMCSGGYEKHIFLDKFFIDFEQAMKNNRV